MPISFEPPRAIVNRLPTCRGIHWLLVAPIFAVLSGSGPAFPDNSGSNDPEFAKVPFVEWFSGGSETRLKWSQRVLPLTLSDHQRLVARFQIQVDGSDLVKRRAAGKIIFYFQFTDEGGRVYQEHGDYDLEKVEKSLRASDVVCSDNAFVLPGDYTVSFAIYIPATGEHAASRETLHVPAVNDDPSPDLWRDLPPVEFLDPGEPPDCWFLPKVRGEVKLPLAPRGPVQIEVMVNLAASQLNTSFYRLKDADLSVLLPYLRVLSQMKGSNIKENVLLLDVNRRRVIFEQRDVDKLDWQKMRSSIMGVNSALIDGASLALRADTAA